MKAKKLIEVAMPIKEISAESVRDKTMHHGHISTLHLWWARRPLPTCRAVVFASLVPDPLDPNCPQAFRDAVNDILCTGIAKVMYSPYPDIPYTAIFDPMEDNLRNRLLMFIGKFSDKCQANMIAGKSTSPKEQLQEGCLIKWESKNDEDVLNRARKLIYVAYNAERRPDSSYSEISEEFDMAWENIKNREEALYSIPNRHLTEDDHKSKAYYAKESLRAAIDQFLSFMPSVFDPFAGGGAIPLEAARLGCRSYGNDINPVAHIIEKGSVEFPQKYGKPITYTRDEFMKVYGEEGLKLLQDRGLEFMGEDVTIPNRLSFDVEFHSKRLIAMTEEKVGYLYPNDEDGNTLIAYYWARTAQCTNPTCMAKVPLLKSFQLSKTQSSKVYINPKIENKKFTYTFERGITKEKGWNNRGNLTCPCCGNIVDAEQLKIQSNSNKLSPIIIAEIYQGKNGKIYRPLSQKVSDLTSSLSEATMAPTERMERNSNGGDTHPWGFTTWGDLFSPRQLYMLNSFLNNLNIINNDLGNSDYDRSIKTLLSIFFDRIVLVNTTFGRWSTNVESVVHLYNRQAVAMNFDFPEPNPFCGVTGSALNQLSWILKYIESESSSPFSSNLENASSGERSQFAPKTIDAVITDPPYYDAIAYADISDFFYVWLKKCLSEVYPLNFSTPRTPKADECTALKHHHNNDYDKAKLHFEKKLLEIFLAIESQTKDIVSIMFAHQSTEAWTTLCNSILGAHMNIQGSWAMDTERDVRMLAIAGDALESSVTVACTPSERKGYGSYKKVKDAIRRTVEKEVKSLYELGFRGADLLTACFGKAVSEFGNYEHVEKADGSEVTVAELLDMARTAAFTALLRDFESDDYTKFYIGWLQLNGMGESDYDDATKFTRAGMNVNIGDIFAHNILIKNSESNTQHLGSYKERTHSTLIMPSIESPLIDKVHHAMLLWKEEERQALLKLIATYGQDINNEFWRVFTVLKELLPEGDDRNQVLGLLNNAEMLIKQSKEMPAPVLQGTIDFGE